jgi:hypothetical protein
VTEHQAPEHAPGNPTYRLIRLSRQDSSWMVLPYGEVSVHKSIGSVRKADDGWIGRREGGPKAGPFRTRTAAAEWVAEASP